MITLERGQFGWDYILRNDDGRSVLIQTDYDYPGVAGTFGWNSETVPHPMMRPGVVYVACWHDGTDGTIDCPSCGTPASMFIASARDYLDNVIGDTVDDPGYFS